MVINEEAVGQWRVFFFCFVWGQNNIDHMASVFHSQQECFPKLLLAPA